MPPVDILKDEEAFECTENGHCYSDEKCESNKCVVISCSSGQVAANHMCMTVDEITPDPPCVSRPHSGHP